MRALPELMPRLPKPGTKKPKRALPNLKRYLPKGTPRFRTWFQRLLGTVRGQGKIYAKSESEAARAHGLRSGGGGPGSGASGITRPRPSLGGRRMPGGVMRGGGMNVR